MSPTANDLILETQGTLRSWNMNAEQATTLSGSIGSGDLTFTVTDVQADQLGISSGVIEIDTELMLVSSVADDGSCTVPPWGRGYLGTTAAEHTANAMVTSQPTFPRATVFDALIEIIGRIFPEVYAAKTANFTTTIPSITYDLPDDAVRLLDARWKELGPQQYWNGVRKMRVNPSSGSTASGGSTGPYSNVTVDIADPMFPGRDLVIEYAARPTQFSAITDDFVAVTGLPLSCKDVLVLGAAAILTVNQELSRLQVATIEQQNRSQTVAPAAALTSSRFLEQKYEKRLAEEASALRAKYPVRLMGVWT
jgi:hypothetical protein